VATTKHVAKIASRHAKPDGLVVVPAGEVTAFLHPLDVAELWGVGEKTATALRRLGLNSVGDLAHTPLHTLRRGLGPLTGAHLHALAWGDDDRVVVPRRGPDEPDRNIGADETFARDVDDPAMVLREVLRLSAKVAARLRTAKVAGRTVTLKVRFADFTTITRSRTLRDATDVTNQIFTTASELYAGSGSNGPDQVGGRTPRGACPDRADVTSTVLGERERDGQRRDRAVDQAVATVTGSSGQARILDRVGH
jgi:DNA polymerase-4